MNCGCGYGQFVSRKLQACIDLMHKSIVKNLEKIISAIFLRKRGVYIELGYNIMIKVYG